MDILDLTTNQLKRAASIKEQIEELNRELRGILGDSSPSAATSDKNRTMRAAPKRKIAASQRAKWAKLRRAKATASHSSRPAKKKVSAATRTKLRAKLKAYWAAKKAKRK